MAGDGGSKESQIIVRKEREHRKGSLHRESVDPIERAALAARRTTRLLLRQIGLESRSGGFPSFANVFSRGKEVPPRVVHLGDSHHHAGEQQVASEGISHHDARVEGLQYADNYVMTAKYTLVTFLPVFLFEVFSRVAYLYFLLQAALSWWSEISPFNPYGGTAALLFVVLVSGVRAAAEDLRRHREDNRTNRSITHVVDTADGSVHDVAWAKLRVGQLVVVRDGEALPADLLCLASALEEGVAFVRTVNLDGETNLKTRRPILNIPARQQSSDAAPAGNGNGNGSVARALDSISETNVPTLSVLQPTTQAGAVQVPAGGDEAAGGSSDVDSASAVNVVGPQPHHELDLKYAIQQVLDMSGVLTCEQPNRSMHRFQGSLRLDAVHNQTAAGLSQDAVEFASLAGTAVPDADATRTDFSGPALPVTMNELLLRGSQLRNTPWVIGIVVYAGPDTRIQMNMARPPVKAGSLDRLLNWQITLLIILQLALSVMTGILSWRWREGAGKARPHLALDDPAQGNWQNPGAYVPLSSLTAWILYSYLVPISLFVTMEIVKFTQATLHISQDQRLAGYVGGGEAGLPGEEVEKCQARNSVLNEDLGRVSHVFSDKTGTLTRNDMRLRQLSVGGCVLGKGPTEFRIEEKTDLGFGFQLLKAWDPALASAVQQACRSPAWADTLGYGKRGLPRTKGSMASMSSAVSVTDDQQSDKLDAPGQSSESDQESQPGVDANNSNATAAQQFLDVMLCILACNTVILEPISEETAKKLEEEKKLLKKKKKKKKHKHQQRPNEPAGSAAADDASRHTAGNDSLAGASMQAHDPETATEISSVHEGPAPQGSQLTTAATATSMGVEKTIIAYQGPSPDEVALVDGARALGFELVGRSKVRRNGNSGSSATLDNPNAAATANDSNISMEEVHVNILGTPTRFQLLNVLEFSSDRKRMSVVVRMPGGQLYAYVKGADNAMLPLLRKDTHQPLLQQTSQDLDYFATQGLRTLVLGRRLLTPEWYADWDARYQEAAASLDRREEKVAELACELEQDVELLGVTAIEDQLQVGVPEAIAALLAAGMRVWMITGDKRETAINIAVSCALFKSAQGLPTVTGHDAESVGQCLSELLGASMGTSSHSSMTDPVQDSSEQLHPSSGLQPTRVIEINGVAVNSTGEPTGSKVVTMVTPETMPLTAGALEMAPVRQKVQPSNGGINDVLLPMPNQAVFQTENQSRLPPLQQGGSLQHDRKSNPSPLKQASSKHGDAHMKHLVVDGQALDFVLRDVTLRQQLALLCSRSSAVLVCRASPAQKAHIVKMMRAFLISEHHAREAADSVNDTKRSKMNRKFHRFWGQSKAKLRPQPPVLLALGDGANDVAMLQAADVGVGLLGREGRQAANSADYVIPHFRAIVPLLLLHGSLCRYRLARLVTYSFYKNVAFWAVLFFFQPFCGWSGQTIIDDISAAFYNVVFTSLPVLVFALLDRPASDDTLVTHPELYASGQPSLTQFSFWTDGVAWGIGHGALAFFIPFLSIVESGMRMTSSLYAVGKTVYTCLLAAVTIEIAVSARYWTWIFAVVVVLSFVLVFPFLAVFGYVEAGIHYWEGSFMGVTPRPLLGSAYYWMALIALICLVMGTRLVWFAAHWLLAPDAFMRLMQEKVLQQQRSRASRVPSGRQP